MIYLLVDLKIVLALHPSDQNRGWSGRGRLSEEGALTRAGALINIWSLIGGGGGGGGLNRAGALNWGNTVFIQFLILISQQPSIFTWIW